MLTSARPSAVLSPLACIALAALSGACAKKSPPVVLLEPRDPPIQHIVLVQLRDDAQAPELLQDAGRSLSTIPGVASYFGGRHFEIGRSGIDSAYSAGFIIGFETEQAYRDYLEHPAHTDFVQRWRPRIDWMRIHDIAEPGSANLTAYPAPGAQPESAVEPTSASPAPEMPSHRRRRSGPLPL